MRKGRLIWIKDVVHMDPPYLVDENGNVAVKGDKNGERLLSGKVKECSIAVAMGNSGSSWLEPFETVDEALKFIEENKDRIYFGSWTHPKLREMFPDVPVKMHPKEIEKRFGIKEEQ